VGFSSWNFTIKNCSHNNNDGTNILAIIEKTLNIMIITSENTDKNTASNKKTNSDDIVFFQQMKKCDKNDVNNNSDNWMVKSRLLMVDEPLTKRATIVVGSPLRG
jgi:hypothetical protein